jgi:hypothetical protein
MRENFACCYVKGYEVEREGKHNEITKHEERKCNLYMS